MEKSVGEGESCYRMRANIGTYCQYWQYLTTKCKKKHIWKYFFTICTFYNDELTNFFYSLKKWKLRSSIFQNLFLNVQYPFNFPPKYPIYPNNPCSILNPAHPFFLDSLFQLLVIPFFPKNQMPQLKMFFNRG